MSNQQDLILMIKSTFPSIESASVAARLLVEQQATACVNLIPGVRSFYMWQDKLENTEEIVLLAKTQVTCYERCEAIIKANHPYQTPEIVAWQTNRQNPDYLDWVTHQLSQP